MSATPTILILAATPIESTFLHLLPPHATLLHTGIGATNTAHALTRALIADPKPTLVIQIGIAGAYVPGGLAVGDVALATDETYGDVGVITPDGWLSAQDIGLPLAPATPGHPARFNHFPLDTALVRRAAGVCAPLVARTGPFLTLSQVTGVRSLGDALFDRFGALCESMEGAVAAHVCALYDVPFLEVRGISNLVEDRDRSRWRIQQAAEAAQRTVPRLLEHVDTLLP